MTLTRSDLEDIIGYSFGGKPVTPAYQKALAFYEALRLAYNTHEELEDAMARVPDYTGQWDPSDYYADEQERFNRAVDNLARVAGVIP